MKTVYLPLGGVGMALRLPDGLADLVWARYGRHRVEDAALRLEVLDLPRAHAVRDGPPSVKTVAGRISLTAFGEAVASVDERTGEGDIYVCLGRRDLGADGLPRQLTTALRMIYAVWLSKSGGLVLHAAGLRLGNVAGVFLGQSGSGKSTLCAMYPHKEVLNDELIAIRFENGEAIAHGVPLDRLSGGRRAVFDGVPVRAFGMIRKATTSSMSPLAVHHRLPLLMRCIGLPAGDSVLEESCFETAGRLAECARWLCLNVALDAGHTRETVHSALGSFS